MSGERLDHAGQQRSQIGRRALQPQLNQEQALRLDLSPETLTAEIDPQRVRQVVANLVSNALRHAAVPGSQVVVSAIRKAAWVEIAVTDNGPGIAPGDLECVFDRFWRGEQARAGGSGLGLTIARELVAAHGGRIWAESSPGKGTAFRFTLPDSPARA